MSYMYCTPKTSVVQLKQAGMGVKRKGPSMARYEPIEGWPGSVLYTAAHGRIYCAAPRGLIPEHPYSMDALRPPTAQEAREWGPGVLPRMVVDVTGKRDFHQAVQRRTLSIAPWNAYLVLRLPQGAVIVAYRLASELP